MIQEKRYEKKIFLEFAKHHQNNFDLLRQKNLVLSLVDIPKIFDRTVEVDKTHLDC